MNEPRPPKPIPLTLMPRPKAFFKEPLLCTFPESINGALKPSRFNLDAWSGRAVYNTSTGNFVVLSSEERRALDAALAGQPVDIEDAPRLYESGLLIDSTIDELLAVRKAFQFATGSRYSPHLTVAPTMDCNFGCSYCFESHTRGAMSDRIQDGVVAFVERLLDDAGESPDLSVTWFGGEPLMAMGVIEALSKRFQALAATRRADSYSADVVTNGFGMSASVLERLRQADVRQIQVTIDGPQAVHDSRRNLKASGGETFTRIIQNLHRASEFFSVVVRVNVDRTNADTIKELFNELDRASLLSCVVVDPSRVEAFSTNRLSADLFTSVEFARWRSALQEWAAERGWKLAAVPVGPSLTGVCQVDSINSFVVDPMGRLFKCWADLGTTAQPVGDVCEPSSWPRRRVGSLAERDPFDDPGCVQCCLLPLCLGGCPKTREVGRATGTSECPSFRHNIKELIQERHGMQTSISNQVAIARE